MTKLDQQTFNHIELMLSDAMTKIDRANQKITLLNKSQEGEHENNISLLIQAKTTIKNVLNKSYDSLAVQRKSK